MSHSAVSSEDKLIKLKSKEGESIPIKIKDARKSTVINRMIDDLALDIETGDFEIPLHLVSSSMLKKVIQYLEEHVDISSDYLASLHENKLSDFDRAFVNIERPELVDLHNASNFMDIQMLKDLCAWAFAETIKGKTYTEINKEWKTANDYSKDELIELKKENDWINQKMG